jgi:hypothetical protein
MLSTMTAPPSIGLLVEPAMERRLRQAVPSFLFTSLRDWLDLAFFDLESSPAAFIVDPLLLPAEHRRQTLERLGQRRHAPVILCARYPHTLTPELAMFLLKMGQLGIRHLLFYGIVDQPHAIRSVLASALLHERHH